MKIFINNKRCGFCDFDFYIIVSELYKAKKYNSILSYKDNILGEIEKLIIKNGEIILILDNKIKIEYKR